MQKHFKKLTALAPTAVMAFSLVAVMAFSFTNFPVYAEGSESADNTDNAISLSETVTEIGQAVEAVNEIQTLAYNAGDFNVTSDVVTGWSYSDKIISITESGAYTITGDGSEHSGYQISVGGNITVELTLSDVMISNSSGAAMYITNTATVTLNLEGNNSFTTTDNSCAGIQFQGASTTSGGSLTITSNAGGSLTATGGETGAGIGGGYGGSGNNITISGGTVTATGGVTGAGIGGGYNRSGSNITITGGTVTATSNSGAGIGGGYNSSGNDITISGGTVTAESEYGAGIGGGRYSSGSSNIVISNGSVKASSASGNAISVTPTDGDASNPQNVYLCEIPNMSGVNNVTVDSATYTRNGDRGSDGAFYLYLTGQDHEITANGTNYRAVWNSTSNSFTLVTYPSGLTATYGDTLSDVQLPTGWAWDYPDTSVGNVGINEFDATYTLNDINVNAKVSVTVYPATPEYTIPEGLVATYGDKLSDVELPTGWTWDNRDASVGDVGTNWFYATYTPEDTTNYSQVREEISVTVEQATPEYTIPEGLVATYGDKLSDVELPTGWDWDNPDASVGDVGTNAFYATYTPEDILNYSQVQVQISVTVNPANTGGGSSSAGTTTGSDTSASDDQTGGSGSSGTGTTTGSDTSTSDDQTGDTTLPQTGDSSNIAFWIALMLASGAGLTGTILYDRKKQYSR